MPCVEKGQQAPQLEKCERDWSVYREHTGQIIIIISFRDFKFYSLKMHIPRLTVWWHWAHLPPQPTSRMFLPPLTITQLQLLPTLRNYPSTLSFLGGLPVLGVSHKHVTFRIWLLPLTRSITRGGTRSPHPSRLMAAGRESKFSLGVGDHGPHVWRSHGQH